MYKGRKIKFQISNKQIEKFGDYFKNNLNKIFKNSLDRYLTAYVRYHWRKVVGQGFSQHSYLVDISNGALFLRAWPDTWSTQIKAYEMDILNSVNTFAGKRLVNHIVFTKYDMEKIKKNSKKIKIVDKTAVLKSKLKLSPLTENEKESIDNSLSKVKDKDLKKLLKKYGTLAKQVQNYRRDNLTRCKICGQFNGNEICNECKLKGEKELKNKVVKLLSDLPYLGFAEALKEIPNLYPDFFNKVRFEMIQRQAKKVKFTDGVTLEAKCLTMLYKSIPPEFLSDKIVMETLKSLRYDLAEPGVFKKDSFKKSENKNLETQNKPRQ